MKTSQKAERFRELHIPGMPLVLVNIWDPGSAIIIAQLGAPAIATGSWSLAAAQGYPDGEQMPLTETMSVVRRIVQCADLPVSVDIEAGYGFSAADVGATVLQLLDTGAVACNIEDSIPGTGELRDSKDQAARLAAARQAADRVQCPVFINARTDVFFGRRQEDHGQSALLETIERAKIYAQSGADGIFVPGLIDQGMIDFLVRHSPLPVNIMAGNQAPSVRALADLGVARISYGPGPYQAAMGALKDRAHDIMNQANWG